MQVFDYFDNEDALDAAMQVNDAIDDFDDEDALDGHSDYDDDDYGQ